MAAHKKGLEPDHAVVGGSGNIFVTQGPRSEHQPYAHANLLEAMRTPLAESSRQSLALFESAPQATVAQPAQTPQTPSPDQELQANPLRARL
jgi:hypothetical protein